MELEKIIESLQEVVDKEVFTEDFKKKLLDEFEIVVNKKVQDLLAEKEEQLKEEFVDKVDKYLTYVAEEFVKENKKNIESELKLEMSEKIIDSIKSVFNEYYIDLKPEEKNVIASLEEQIGKLKGELNEALKENLNLKDELLKAQIKAVFVEETKDLTDVEREEILDMLEGIEVNTVEDFVNKLNIIKEKYLNLKKDKAVTESAKQQKIEEAQETEEREFGKEKYSVDDLLPDFLKRRKRFVQA